MVGRYLSMMWVALFLSACVYPPGLRGKENPRHLVEKVGDEERFEPERWYYVEMEDTVCANGSSAGLGFNRGRQSSDLVIYVNGGGGCWDSSSCHLFRTAANLDVSYDKDRLGEEIFPLVESGLLDRSAEVHPWQDASMAFIPYCTADLHVGNTSTLYDSFAGEKPVHHRGAENLQLYLRFLSKEMPEVERVWLVGVSAGGYGVAWNFHHFRDAFPEAEVHALFDASAWLPLSETQWQQWKENWAMEMPRGCVMCRVSPDHLPRYLVQAYPESRFAMTVFERDATLAIFTKMLPVDVERHLQWFLEERFRGENARVFVANGTGHEVLLHLNDGLSCREGQDLVEFVYRWANGG